MNDTVVAARDVQLRRGERSILKRMTFEVARGEIVALMGASGSGKTTMLRAIAALETFDTGAIVVDQVALAPGVVPADTLCQLRRKVGMVFQFHCLFEHLTVVDNITLCWWEGGAAVLVGGRRRIRVIPSTTRAKTPLMVLIVRR